MVVAVTRAVIAYGIFFAIILTVVGVTGVPRTIGLIQPILLFLLITFSRFVARFWLGGMYIEQLRQGRKPRDAAFSVG